jgi:hypothetical protein
MLTKKAYTLEELFLYLEALEMLDMVYTVQKYPEVEEEDGNILPNVWIIEYKPNEVTGEEPVIEFED